MKTERKLNGKGKGEFFYDYKFDSLMFKIKDRDYAVSVEFQNFVIDIDTEDFVTGIRIFDASKVTGLPKLALKNIIQGEFTASIKDNVVTVRFKFVGKQRNKLFSLLSEKQDFTQQFSTPLGSKYHLQDSFVIVPEII